MKPRVFIARPIQDTVVQRVAEISDVNVHRFDSALSSSELARQLTDADGVISVGGNITKDVLAGAPKLKVVANIGAGYDTIDVKSCTERRIVVTNTPDVLTESTADFAFALLLAVSRRVFEADRYVREDQWKAGLWNLLWGTELYGKTIGLFGFGRIGQAMARRARGFSMRVLYYARHRATGTLEADLQAEYADIDTLFRESDFLSIHAPLNDESFHAVNAGRLGLMKQSAFIINTARGKIINEADLVRSLKSGQIAGAGLDVFENEPQIDPALKTMGNVVLAPHIASATEETRYRMADLAASNLLAFFKGNRPPNIVNPEVLDN